MSKHILIRVKTAATAREEDDAPLPSHDPLPDKYWIHTNYAIFLAAPHDFMAKMHQNYPPIFYDVGEYGNAWLLIKHEDALFALRHWEYFSNEGATPFPRDPNDYFYFIPIEIDPPHHRKYRNIVDPLFSRLRSIPPRQCSTHHKLDLMEQHQRQHDQSD